MGFVSLVLTERRVHIGSWIIIITLATIERVQVALILAVVAHFVPGKLYSCAALAAHRAHHRVGDLPAAALRAVHVLSLASVIVNNLLDSGHVDVLLGVGHGDGCYIHAFVAATVLVA